MVSVAAALGEVEGDLAAEAELDTVADVDGVVLGDLDDVLEANALADADPETELDLLGNVDAVANDEGVLLLVDEVETDMEPVPDGLGLPLVLAELVTLTIADSVGSELGDTEGEDVTLGEEVGEAEVVRVAKGESELVVDPEVVFVDVGVGDPLGVDELDLDVLDDAVLVGVMAKVLVEVIDCVDVGVTLAVFDPEMVLVLVTVARVLGVPSAVDVVDVVALGEGDDEAVASEDFEVLAEGELETVATGERVDVGVFSVEDVPVIEGDELADELPDGDTDTVGEELAEAIDVRLAGGEAELVAVELAEAVPVLVSDTLGVTDPLGDAVGVAVIDLVATGDLDATDDVDGDLDDEDVFELDAEDVVVLVTLADEEEDLELVIDGVLAAVDVVVLELFVVGLVEVVGSEDNEAFAELVVETDAVPDRVTDVDDVLVLDTEAEGVEVGVDPILLVGLLDTEDEIVAALDGVLTGVTDDDALGSEEGVPVTVPNSLSVGNGVALLVADAADDADD